ncbi:helix-turn-helix domain-containing protein [Bacteroidota bacterium]
MFGSLDGLPFLFGPLHYFYAKFLISPNLKFKKIYWIHFLPFLIHRLYTLHYLFLPDEELIEIIQGIATENLPLVSEIFTGIVIFQGIFYMIITLRLLLNYSKRIKECYSSIEKIDLNWLKVVTLMTFSVWILVLIVHSMRMTGTQLFAHHDQIISAATTILIYSMGYLGFRQVEIFSSTSSISSLPLSVLTNENTGTGITDYSKAPISQIDKVNTGKYEKSGLSEEKAKQHLSELINLMEREKPFINSSLTLQDLSEKLSVSTHNLSEVINSQLEKSFFDFINQYRVEEVKKALIDPERENYTLLAIALEAGFNSKSSFNSIFKKHTDMTPSEYKKSIIEPISQNITDK